MKLGRFPRAAVVLAVSALSVVAAAQSGQDAPGLNIPQSVQFVGQRDPSVRKATAIVNGDVITESDIDHRLALILNAQQVELPAEEVERVRAQILRNLIDETLQIQAAVEQEIELTDADVNRIYANAAQRAGHNAQSFGDFLRSIGSSERTLKRQIRAEIAWQNLQGRYIEPFVSVSEDEVQAIVDRLNASRGTSEYRVAEIFISATPETAAEARNNAQRIIQQVRAGASFPAYARQFSEASTAALGGDLGWVRAEQLPPELSSLVTQMPVGAISEPIQVPGGFSIVALADTRQILTADPRDAVLSLIQMSIPLPPGTPDQQVLASGQRLAQATRGTGGCGGAAAAAQAVGAEFVSNDQVPVRNLPPLLQQMLLNLNIGEATPPFGGAAEQRVSVLLLCGRDDPEQATMPSADDIEARLSEERVARRAQRYLRDLRRDAVIDYR